LNNAAPGITSPRTRNGTSPQLVRPPAVGSADQIADADHCADP
jgi:hypothetical protein